MSQHYHLQTETTMATRREIVLNDEDKARFVEIARAKEEAYTAALLAMPEGFAEQFGLTKAGLIESARELGLRFPAEATK